ncbi:hypothetical protein Dsin_008580 [Dipteronia sinensis]|uniref:Reverse transcriptase n=1 Tax=Dipteronia sinensis TaxID=43782 RepID=A0AAE0APN6_9ROSI|nr:hypothetical protein Dsin_008580 [Dipteronia sinensis]
MNPVKAPRSDGLPTIFFQKYWDSISTNVIGACAIAKAITNRLGLALGEVISDTRCPFIPGRLILENTIVCFECLHRLKRRRRKKDPWQSNLIWLRLMIGWCKAS